MFSFIFSFLFLFVDFLFLFFDFFCACANSQVMWSVLGSSVVMSRSSVVSVWRATHSLSSEGHGCTVGNDRDPPV